MQRRVRDEVLDRLGAPVAGQRLVIEMEVLIGEGLLPPLLWIGWVAKRVDSPAVWIGAGRLVGSAEVLFQSLGEVLLRRARTRQFHPNTAQGSLPIAQLTTELSGGPR